MKGFILIDTNDRFSDDDFDYELYNMCKTCFWNIIEIDYKENEGISHGDQLIINQTELNQLKSNKYNYQYIIDDEEYEGDTKYKCEDCLYCSIRKKYDETKYHWYHGYFSAKIITDSESKVCLIRPNGISIYSEKHKRNLNIGVEGGWFHLKLFEDK